MTWMTSRALIFGRFLEIFKLSRDRILATPLTTMASSTSRLFSDISNLLTHLTPGSAFSMTVAPPAPRLLLEIFSSTSLIPSLQANPRSRCFRASTGSLPWDMLRYFKHTEVAKNCLKEAGISPLDFLAENGFLARLRWERWRVHPRTKALKSISDGISVEDRSRMEITFGWARKLAKIWTSSRSEFPERFR